MLYVEIMGISQNQKKKKYMGDKLNGVVIQKRHRSKHTKLRHLDSQNIALY